MPREQNSAASLAEVLIALPGSKSFLRAALNLPLVLELSFRSSQMMLSLANGTLAELCGLGKLKCRQTYKTLFVSLDGPICIFYMIPSGRDVKE